MASPSPHDELPHQERLNYKKLCKCYDENEYKKGIAIADAILVKAPRCSDVIAMKGLCTYHTESLEDALAVIKEAVKTNFTASSLWHALGVIYKTERDDQQAFACFKRANQFDGNRNTHSITRDAASMAIAVRDWAYYSELRQKLLGHKSDVRYNWCTYAVAQHMLGNAKVALSIMDTMGLVMEWGDTPNECSEVHLYRAQLAIEADMAKEAVSILTKERVTDRCAKFQLLAKAYSMSAAKNAKENSEKAYLELFAMGLEQREVLFQIAKLRGIAVDPTPSNKSKAGGRRKVAPAVSEPFVALLDEVHAKFPKADPPKRCTLDYCTIAELPKRLQDYCRPLVAKMVPSLVSVLKSLYACPERTKVIEQVFTAWEKQLVADDGAEFAKAAPHCALTESKPNPLWLNIVLQVLATHYMRVGDYTKAHAYVDRAIEHTPTVEMLHVTRAKIFKREGNLTEAAFHADVARKLDLQDRYLNTKAAKYFLRAGDIEAAEHITGLFLKINDQSEVLVNMFDMQASYFELPLIDGFVKRNDPINAIKTCKILELHYKHNHDELMDYHAYTIRRCNLRSFLEVIRNDDNATGQAHFLAMCPRIIRAYMDVHELGTEEALANFVPRPKPTDSANWDKNEANDKKRLQKLQDDFDVKVDLSDPLASCAPYVQALQKHQPASPETHELAFEVALRQSRFVLAAAAITALGKCQGPDVAASVASLKKRLGIFVEKEKPASAAVANVVKAVL
jgi:tetratricopeptide (TPR) repeat protein